MKKTTILGKFGLVHDKDVDAFFSEENFAYSYPDLDFAISIHRAEGEDKQFFIRKDDLSGGYVLAKDYPLIKHLFSLIDNV